MTAPGQALTAIAGGISRLRTRGGASKDSLFNLVNGYVTQAGTVKVRPGSLRDANIGQYSGAGKTKGLVAYQNQFHIFSANVVPIPPNYALHVLSYPKLSSLTQTITTVPPAGDPSWANVVLLMTMDGANGIQSAQDFSNYAHSINFNTSSGNSAISSTTPKFGTGSLKAPGGQNYLNSFAVDCGAYAGGTPLDLFSTNNWTIEFFVRCGTGAATGSGLSMDIMAYGDTLTGGLSSCLFMNCFYDTTLSTFQLRVVDYSTYGTNNTSTWTVSSPITTWHHFALVSNGGVLTGYMDGVPSAADVNWNPAHYTHSGSTHVVLESFGRHSGGSGLVGYLDELRVTAGVARYTAAFTPPAVPFPLPTYTVDGPELKEIHFSAPYLGGLYVVAEFDVSDAIAAEFGSVFHYWIQSSTGGDNSNFWEKSTDYVLGDVVIPTVPNGLIYTAARKDPANPVWTPNTAEAMANVVEPTIANGFKYTVTLVEGAAPTTGTSEPVWPTSEGATVDENSALQNDQSFAVATAAPAAAPPVPTRYQNNGGVF